MTKSKTAGEILPSFLISRVLQARRWLPWLIQARSASEWIPANAEHQVLNQRWQSQWHPELTKRH